MSLKYLKDTIEEFEVRITEKSWFYRVFSSFGALPFLLLFVGGAIGIAFAIYSMSLEGFVFSTILGICVLVIFGLPMMYLLLRLGLERIRLAYSQTHSTLQVGIEGITKTQNGIIKNNSERLLLSQVNKVVIEPLTDKKANIKITPKTSGETLYFEHLPTKEAKELKEKIELVLEHYKLPPTG